MKRLLPFFLCLALMFGIQMMLVSSALAQTNDVWVTEEKDGHVTITGYYGPGGDLVIPSELGGSPVTSVGEYAFCMNDEITCVTVPTGVVSIGIHAFDECGNLEMITLPDTLTDIGYAAFCDCSKLNNVTLPRSVKTIAFPAFDRCDSLTALSVDPDNPYFKSIDNVIFDKTGKTLLFCATGKSGNYTIPDGVEVITHYAFEHCSGLSGITIPEGVTSIGAGAFGYCSGLTSILIPSSVNHIDNNPFEGCENIYELSVAAQSPFFKSIDNVVFNKSGNELHCCAGGKTGSYTIPSSVTHIMRCAFSGCSLLTSVIIPDSVIYIDENAFYWCTNLQSVIIPGSVTEIGARAFEGCHGLTKLKISDKVTTIHAETFAGCESLTSVTIPDGVESIGDRAFMFCYDLEFVIIPTSVSTIGGNAFGTEGALASIYYSGSESQWNMIAIDQDNEYLFNATIYFNSTGPGPDENDWKYIIVNGSAEIKGFYGAGGDVTIPSSLGGLPVTCIGNGAFYHHAALSSVLIPEGVVEIGDDAFSGCIDLKEVAFPNSVMSIGIAAFQTVLT